jgi:hypothetical protein
MRIFLNLLDKSKKLVNLKNSVNLCKKRQNLQVFAENLMSI